MKQSKRCPKTTYCAQSERHLRTEILTKKKQCCYLKLFIFKTPLMEFKLNNSAVNSGPKILVGVIGTNLDHSGSHHEKVHPVIRTGGNTFFR